MRNREKLIKLFNLIKNKKLLSRLIVNPIELFNLTNEELDLILEEENNIDIIKKINFLLSEPFKTLSFEDKKYFINIILKNDFNLTNFSELINIFGVESLKEILQFILKYKNNNQVNHTLSILKSSKLLSLVKKGKIDKEELKTSVYKIASEKKICNTITYARFFTNKAVINLLSKEKMNLNEMFEILEELGKCELISKERFIERIIQRPKIINLFLSEKNYREYFKEIIKKLNFDDEYKARYISNVTKNQYILSKLEKKEISKNVFIELIDNLLKLDNEDRFKEVLQKTKEINNDNFDLKMKEIFNLFVNNDLKTEKSFVRKNTKI